MNVEKMRRQLARRAEEAEQAERRQWLNTLTPEHRAMHERPNPLGICGVCISERSRLAGEAIGRAVDAFAARDVGRRSGA